MLKNAKDACATEALEIATYTAIEQLARSVGDERRRSSPPPSAPTRRRCSSGSCASSRSSPTPSSAPTSKDDPSYDVTKTGAADAARKTADEGRSATHARRPARCRASRRPRARSRAPSPRESDLAIAGYDKLTAEEIVSKLSELSQIDLAKVDSYERKHQNRTTVIERITTLRGDEPWPGYDELTVSELQTALGKADDDRIKAVRTYERAHKARAGVLKATERELATA